MKNNIFLFLFWMVFQTGFSQAVQTEKLDHYLKILDENHQFMGSVAVSRNNEIIYSASVGFSDIEENRKAGRNTRYRIGSISKTYTAVLVFKAIESGKLNPDQVLADFFPSVPNSDRITIRHLLAHRSGIANYTDREDYFSWHTRPKTREELTALIAEESPRFDPDRRFEYSNSNYLLLSLILEEVYQKDFASVLKEEITGPLGLEKTSMGGTINPENGDARSYEKKRKWQLQPETDLSIPLGAGGIVATAEEVTRFAEALFGGKLISEASLETMKTLQDGIGMGLFQIPFYQHPGFGHSGKIDEFTSVFSYFPEDNISFALTSNGSNININDVSIAVLSAVFGIDFQLPEFSDYEPGEADLKKLEGLYASRQLPLKITVTEEDGILTAQGSGQPSFPAEPVSENRFENKRAGVVLEFLPEENKMILKQAGMEFIFEKE